MVDHPFGGFPIVGRLIQSTTTKRMKAIGKFSNGAFFHRHTQLNHWRKCQLFSSATINRYSSGSFKDKSIFHSRTPDEWKVFFEQRQQFGIVKHLRFQFVSIEHKKFTAKLLVENDVHMAPNGFMHAAGQIFLADTACGFGAYAHLPAADNKFTTIEIKSNFLGTAKPGDTLYCTAELRHAGRTTQVWDAECYVLIEGEKRVTALFRCTQAILGNRV